MQTLLEDFRNDFNWIKGQKSLGTSLCVLGGWPLTSVWEIQRWWCESNSYEPDNKPFVLWYFKRIQLFQFNGNFSNPTQINYTQRLINRINWINWIEKIMKEQLTWKPWRSSWWRRRMSSFGVATSRGSGQLKRNLNNQLHLTVNSVTERHGLCNRNSTCVEVAEPRDCYP